MHNNILRSVKQRYCVLCVLSGCSVCVLRGICGLVSQNNNVSPDITPLTTSSVQLRWHKPHILTTLTITTDQYRVFI